MLQLLTGIPWVDRLRLATMNPVRKTKHLTVTVDGDDRDATWKEGVGIYVSGHDFGKGDTVLIESKPLVVVEMRRMVMEAEPLTLITKFDPDEC